jgi:hypothetical protein
VNIDTNWTSIARWKKCRHISFSHYIILQIILKRARNVFINRFEIFHEFKFRTTAVQESLFEIFLQLLKVVIKRSRHLSQAVSYTLILKLKVVLG